jgi:cytochrome oxidase Cu insertion factor (SCO1/SenC/PrrC family)
MVRSPIQNTARREGDLHMGHHWGGMVARTSLSLVVVASGVLGGVAVRAAPPPSLKVAVDKPAPDFNLTLLSGEPVRLIDFRGKVVVLNFWASW